MCINLSFIASKVFGLQPWASAMHAPELLCGLQFDTASDPLAVQQCSLFCCMTHYTSLTFL